MKLAVISPRILEPMAEPIGYQLALSQYLIFGTDYQRYFQHFAAMDHFIIVDNGAAEGERMSFDRVVLRANSIKADEIIMPDELGDADQTLSMTLDTAASYAVPQIYRRMVVPQGRSWEEFEYCLDTLVSRLEFGSIGVAKHLEQLPGGRVMAFRMIFKKGLHLRHHIHMLGIWRNPRAEINEAPRWVRGIDTAAPIAYAQQGKPITDEMHYSLDWFAEFDRRLAVKNVAIMQRWCREKRYAPDSSRPN